jgi:hypothetical protein
MRVPILASLLVVGLIVFKVIAVGSIVMALMVLAPLLLAFAIVGGVFVGLVGLGWLVVRFMLFCLRGFRRAEAPAAAGPVPPRPPQPPPHYGDPRQPQDIYGRRQRLSWRERRMLYRQRDPSSWGVLASALLVFCVLAIAFRSSVFTRSRVGDKVTHAISRAAEKLKARKIPIHSNAGARPVTPVAPEEPISISEPADLGSPPWVVVGRGEESDDAYQDALEKAQKKVTEYLRARSPPVQWTPKTGEIGRLVKDQKEEEPPRDVKELGLNHQTTLRVDISPEDFKKILQFDGRERMEERLLFLLKGLAAVVAVLAAIAGYIRLDEWSKGYYTGWLRLGAAGFVAAAVACLWLFFSYEKL